ncbi:hypothetical protein [Curvibacter lanceolatus]|uniref:recombination directionality factor n=1 Tax=Curvibacter lanceolatus TaxID=86182 RepID=UPI000380F978|nr:hypothetical protein [Curvibacter lanceolatus]
MLKGLALTPPIIGRISIGRVVEKDGKRLPAKDDEFTITSQVQMRGSWVNHPLDEALRKNKGRAEREDGTEEHIEGSPTGSSKLRSIPVRLLFDDPDLNLRAQYTLFDRVSGRPVCVGNGETCRRATGSGVQTLPCSSPESSEWSGDRGCKPFGRLNVRIDVEDQEGDVHHDELGSFVFRTTGFNSIRTLAARLKYFQAISGGVLSTMPLELRLRGKSTTLSRRAAIYYVDLTVRSGMTASEAVLQAKSAWERRQATGFDQVALDAAAREGLSLGAFEESEEDGPAVVEEFFAPPQDEPPDQPRNEPQVDQAEHLTPGQDQRPGRPARSALAAKLGRRLERSQSTQTDLGQQASV